MTDKTCCFTGHRPQKLPFGFREEDAQCMHFKSVLCSEIKRMICFYGVTHFISGMALGTDMFAAEAVLKLKMNYPHITLEAAVPFEGQYLCWSSALQMRYHRLLAQCDFVTVLQQKYDAHCLERRNRYMVDRADYVLAMWNGTPGGTANTICYAEHCGKTIIIPQWL